MEKEKEKIAFLKRLHGLENKEVEWCIIDEDEDGYALGLSVVGTRLYLDIVARRFRTTVKLPELSRQVYPAVEVPTDEKDTVVFAAKDDPQKKVFMTSTFIDDIYGSMIYQPEMENELLL